MVSISSLEEGNVRQYEVMGGLGKACMVELFIYIPDLNIADSCIMGINGQNLKSKRAIRLILCITDFVYDGQISLIPIG